MLVAVIAVIVVPSIGVRKYSSFCQSMFARSLYAFVQALYASSNRYV